MLFFHSSPLHFLDVVIVLNFFNFCSLLSIGGGNFLFLLQVFFVLKNVSMMLIFEFFFFFVMLLQYGSVFDLFFVFLFAVILNVFAVSLMFSFDSCFTEQSPLCGNVVVLFLLALPQLGLVLFFVFSLSLTVVDDFLVLRIISCFSTNSPPCVSLMFSFDSCFTEQSPLCGNVVVLFLLALPQLGFVLWI